MSLVDRKGAELALLLGAAVLGAAFDGLLAGVGFYTFEADSALLPIPLWLVATWMGFAGTLRSSMTFMASRPRLMTLMGTLLAPVTYLGAERLGAVTFTFGVAPTAVVIGLSWWALTPILLRLEANTRDLDLSRIDATFITRRREV
jgi:hypothetical protein